MANHQADSIKELNVLSNISQTTPCKSLWSFGQSMLLFGLSLDIEEDYDIREGRDSSPGTEGNSDSQGFGMRLDTLAGDRKVSKTGLESKERKEA
jgi:hypothetical protein